MRVKGDENLNTLALALCALLLPCQQAHPSAHDTTLWYRCSHKLHSYHRAHLSSNALAPKLFSTASATKIFACSARHDTWTKPSVVWHAHMRTSPSFVFECKACVQM